MKPVTFTFRWTLRSAQYRIVVLLFLVAGLAASCKKEPATAERSPQGGPAAPVAPDLSTPLLAATAFFTAVETGDMSSLNQSAFGTDAQFDSLRRLPGRSPALARYELASMKKFGPEKGKLPADLANDRTRALARTLAMGTSVSMEGETATLIFRGYTRPLTLKKRGDHWRVDLNSVDTELLTQDATTAVHRIDTIAGDIEAGRYQSAEAAMQVLRVCLRIVPVSGLEIIPEAELSETPGGVPNVGTGGDATREARQNIDDTADSNGFSRKPGPTVTDSGGGSGDSSTGIIPVPGGAFGRGSGNGQGSGNGTGSGGPLAPFGVPGGGGAGIKGRVFDNGDARKIVFVCDRSGSMINKLPALKDQLSKTILKLRPSQSFEVIFLQEQDCLTFSKFAHKEGLVPATPEAKRALSGRDGFLEGITAAGGTDPIPGLVAAFKCHPQLIYLLTDGDFPDNDAVLKKINELNTGTPKVKINTIAFTGDGDNDTGFLKLLEQIAKDSGGVFRHVKESDIENN